MADNKEKFVCSVAATTFDGSTNLFSVYLQGILFQIVGPKLYWHSCSPSIKSIEDVKREVERVFDVKVTDVSFPQTGEQS